MTDPIADMLTRIRNGVKAKKKDIIMPSSNLKVEVARILKEEGYIRNYKVVDEKKHSMLSIALKYNEENKSVIGGIKRVSKPGCRIYCAGDSVPKVLDGLGTMIISTSKGVMAGRKCEELGIGGEVLCSIW